VAQGDRKMLEEMSITHPHGKIIGGHYARPISAFRFTGTRLAAWGRSRRHAPRRRGRNACGRAEAMQRYGSAWLDVASQGGRSRKGFGLAPLHPRDRRLARADDLIDGHMDRVLRHAIEQDSTADRHPDDDDQPAEHFGLSKEMGLIAPGRWADVVLVKDLKKFKADV